VPWKPRITESELRSALLDANSWREALTVLGYAYHGKNIATLRKWAERWAISTDHLTDNRGRRRQRRYTDAELAEAVAASRSWAETLRRLGYCPSGNNWRTLKRRTRELGISTHHFDPYAAARRSRSREAIPLERILVEGSTYSRSSLKRRLYESGLKERRCELCGQGEHWNGRRIGLILDHVNGVRDDNRIENLRIACPNCAAGLETHCGRKNRLGEVRQCVRCGVEFVPRSSRQRYCSRDCGSRWDRRGVKRPGARKAKRPSHDQLTREVEELGYRAVGRRYGVSDNAIRKWLLEHGRQLALAAGIDPATVASPRRTWPNRRRRRKKTGS
jgi:hypothetical protein